MTCGNYFIVYISICFYDLVCEHVLAFATNLIVVDLNTYPHSLQALTTHTYNKF